MLRRVFIVVTAPVFAVAIFLQMAAAQTSSLYTGRVAEARAHFRTYGLHMRGVVLMSEAVFMTQDGKDIPYDRVTFRVNPTSQGGRTVCFEVVKERCEPIPLDQRFVVPVMNWISSGGTAAFTLAEERSLAFLKSADMQPVPQDKDNKDSANVFAFQAKEYVATPLNVPALTEFLQDVDYESLVGPVIISDEAKEIIKTFNDGVVTAGGKRIDATYTVNDYFSQFIVNVGDNSVSYSGVPTRLYWELYDGQAPFAKGIRPLLLPVEIKTNPDGTSSLLPSVFLQSLKEIWDDHVAACSKKQYPAKIRAVDRYLAFVKAGRPASQKEAIVNELEKQQIEDLPDAAERTRLVERQKQCDKQLLSSVSQKLAATSASNPSLQSAEDATRSLPKGFEDVLADLQEMKDAAILGKRRREEAIANEKQLQQRVLDFYRAVAILRGFHNRQPQAFAVLLSQLSR
jgi:hypothetical protein